MPSKIVIQIFAFLVTEGQNLTWIQYLTNKKCSFSHWMTIDHIIFLKMNKMEVCTYFTEVFNLMKLYRTWVIFFQAAMLFQ